MAANSLLYLLLTAGLTSPPDQSVTTESFLEYTRQPSYGPTDDTTQWPGYDGKLEDRTIRWRQEPPYSTEDPSHQYTAPFVTESENADETVLPFEQAEYKTYKPYEHPLATEEPQQETERYGGWTMATEEPENETEQPEARPHKKGFYPCPQNEHYKRCGTVCPHTCFETRPCPSNCCVEGCFCNKGLVRDTTGICVKPEVCPLDSIDEKGKRRCPPREHFSRCHKNCEKTCTDYMKPKPCPRSCKRGCICDGGLVRNKEGRCVPRDQCQKKLRAEDDDSHGCPYEYACDVYCIRKGKRSGRCEGDTCHCSER
ncbi:unnamed protein product [Larinioides sclopetarius]|uniref:TIL domain-containing protein n=1 Tax=Larinioides sclopetarius TaxID=280406 RepID=A0AAV2BP73_9ARAC